jgi:AraC-like DNA-binding protein
MTFFPIYKQLTDYPSISEAEPIYVSVNQIDHRFPAHRHDFLECSFVISGFGKELVNGAQHELRPGTFSFLLPFQIHELQTTSKEPLQLFNCMFDMNLLTGPFGNDVSITELLTGPELPSYLHTAEGVFERFHRMWDELFTEFKSEEKLWRLPLLRVRLVELLALFDRERRSLSPMLSHTAEEQKGKRNIWPIVQYINQHYREDLTLSGLAQRFEYSTSRLSETFKSGLGVSFVQFLHELRIRHACSLLVMTDQSVLEIAYEVGFQSFKTFSRIFRELKDTTPKAYRQSHSSKP